MTDLDAMLAGKQVLFAGASSGIGENFSRLASASRRGHPTEGNSYRLREHADLVPETMNSRSSLIDPKGQQPTKRRPGRSHKEPRDHLPG